MVIWDRYQGNVGKLDFRKEEKWNKERREEKRGRKEGSGERKVERREETGEDERRKEKKKRTQRKNGGKVKMKKEKCVVYRSQLLGPWRQQPPSFSFTLQPHCPHWHRYNSVLT